MAFSPTTLASAANTTSWPSISDNLAATGVKAEDLAKVVIAYEPIWAIGTGKTATAEQANEVIAYIRQVVRDIYGDLADQVRIQYGVSVKPANVAEIM